MLTSSGYDLTRTRMEIKRCGALDTDCISRTCMGPCACEHLNALLTTTDKGMLSSDPYQFISSTVTVLLCREMTIVLESRQSLLLASTCLPSPLPVWMYLNCRTNGQLIHASASLTSVFSLPTPVNVAAPASMVTLSMANQLPVAALISAGSSNVKENSVLHSVETNWVFS